MDSPRFVAVISRDLIFKSKISEAARSAGWTVKPVRDLADLEAALQDGASLVLFDLAARDIDRPRMLSLVKSNTQPVKVVSYLSHVEHELRDQAMSEGFEDVLPRSAFVKLLPKLLAET